MAQPTGAIYHGAGADRVPVSDVGPVVYRTSLALQALLGEVLRRVMGRPMQFAPEATQVLNSGTSSLLQFDGTLAADTPETRSYVEQRCH